MPIVVRHLSSIFGSREIVSTEQELKSAYRRHCQRSDGTVGREQRGIARGMSSRVS